MVALLWALFAESPPEVEVAPQAPPGSSQQAGPSASRVEAPGPSDQGGDSGGRGAKPRPSASRASTPGATPAQRAYRATLEIEVLGTSQPAQVDLLWSGRDAKGREETFSELVETGSGNLARATLSWGGRPETRVQVRAFDERGRRVFLELTLKEGVTRRERLELPLTPILEVRKPASRGLDMHGIVRIYRGPELLESPGVFANLGEVAVLSPGTKGRCRVVVRAQLFEKDGDLAGWLYGEQEVELEPGLRTLVAPVYVAMASLRVRVLRPDGSPLSAAQVALRCGEGPSHDCQAAHHGEAGGRGGGLSFGDDADEDEPEPPAVADPAPLLGSHLAGEEVFLRPGAYEVLASGNDASLARAGAQVALAAGARRTLELRLPEGRDVELRLPEVTSEELDFVIEGPPGASAALEAGRILRVRGLLESDSVRVRARRWVGEEAWGEQVLLRAGARHNLGLVRSGKLELRLRRADGSQSDLEGGVTPETPQGLGRYRATLSDHEEEPRTWFKGDEEGHWGRVTHAPLSSILDASEEEGVYTIQLLPGSHWVEVEAPSGVVRIPITVSAGQTVRVDRVIK